MVRSKQKKLTVLGYVITLAAIPVAAISWASVPRTISPQIVAKAVDAEGVREQRMDDGTFRARWVSVADMPPTRETVYEPLLLVSHEGVARTNERQTVGATVSARPRQMRKVALRSDICARHHMRRVSVRHGRWTGWRCRR